MSRGLPRKIRIAFIFQAMLVSLAVLVGGYLVSLVIKYSLVNTVLQEEATYYWSNYRASPATPPPNTQNIRGYLLTPGQNEQNLPERLRGLSAGFHEVDNSDLLVLVDEVPEGRLYLVFLRSRAERLAFWFGVVPVLVILLAIYAVSWITYRTSSRLVSPVSWLAREVSQWDPRHPDANGLAPEKLPADVQGEAKQLAAALHALASRVTEHVARERNFTRDASHELRTPLTVIRMASDMALGDPELSPRLQRSLQRIQRAGRDMEAVIDAFLILARESDIEPQSEQFDVADVVRYEASIARELLAGRPVQLQVHVEGSCPLLAPPRVVHVVVSNLLRNACSFTDEGQIDVEVGEGVLVIRDTGIGIAADTLGRIFEPFFRVERNGPQGIGLGLSIVRRLCERFGWDVRLESEAGRGTVVTVRFY